MKPLVSLIRHPVACSARINVDTHTHTQTDRQTNYVTLAAHARRGLITRHAIREPHIRMREHGVVSRSIIIIWKPACPLAFSDSVSYHILVQYIISVAIATAAVVHN